MSPLIAPILFFPLPAGALLTLFYRARRGRSLLVAHAEHIYQIAIIAGWTHARIAVTYWFAMAVCGAIAVLVSRDAAHIAPAIALAAMTGLAIALDLAVRRGAEIRGILKP